MDQVTENNSEPSAKKSNAGAVFSYQSDMIFKLSHLLENSARSLGATAFFDNNEMYPLHVAMDPDGPILWAMVMHAEAITNYCGVAEKLRGNVLPFTVAESSDTPYGITVVIQPSALPFGAAYQFLDASLEHAICLGMRDLGYTPEQWMELPEDQRGVPLEPFKQDLRQNWINEHYDSGSVPNMLANWPSLLDAQSLTHQMLNQNLGANADHVFRFPSAR